MAIERKTMIEEEVKKSTQVHINQVGLLIDRIIKELTSRLKHHDESKFSDEEWPIFTKYTTKLKDCTYGSEEYKKYLSEMKPALDHHYAANRHHPEHFLMFECNGCFKQYKSQVNVCDICGGSQFTERSDISQMNLVDLIEMFCDWMAATKRHADGNIDSSIEKNKERFGYDEIMEQIFHNTAHLLKNSQ